MKANDDFPDRILTRAGQQNHIRALLMDDSMTESEGTDSLSNYEINVFVTASEPYMSTMEWMSDIVDVMVYIPVMGTNVEETYPTRLVIFRVAQKCISVFYPRAFSRTTQQATSRAIRCRIQNPS